MRTLLPSLVLALAAAACGGSKSAPPPPTPAVADCHLDGPDGTPSTAEQCECAGLQVVGDIGDGNVACPEGTAEVSRIAYGIEGGVCCATTKPAAP